MPSSRCLFWLPALLLIGGACAEKTTLDADRGFRGISAASPTGTLAIAADGLVAAYDMETITEAGRLRDFSGNGHHGSLEDHHAVDGPYGRAKQFRSVTDRMHITEHPAFDLDGPFTIAAWVRVDSLDLHQHIVACDDKWALWVTPANQYRLGDTRGGGWSTEAGRVERGRWASVVSVLRGTAGDSLHAGTVALYVEGEPAAAAAHLRSAQAQATGTWGPGPLYPDDACYVGFESHQGNAAHARMPFVGAVDELLIFSRALTIEEIRAFAGR